MILSVSKDLTRLKLDALIELIEIDASSPDVGASSVLYLTNSEGSFGSSLSWQGTEYQPWPVRIEDVETSGQGAANRPVFSVGNATGIFSVLCYQFKDLVGAKVTRRRVLAKYLDGMPSANVLAGLPEDVWFIEQKKTESSTQVTWSLANGLDLEGIRVPKMRVNATYCQVRFYRGPECSYNGTDVMTNYKGELLTLLSDKGAYSSAVSYIVGDYFYVLHNSVRFYYATIMNAPAGTSLANRTFFEPDVCTRLLNSGCEPRFGVDAELPFLAFPGTGRLPQP